MRRPIGVKAILAGFAALALLLLAACGDDDEGTTAADDTGGPGGSVTLEDLDGSRFASVRVEGHRLRDGTRVVLGFDGDRLSANAGCNHLFGTASLAGGTLTVSAMGGTEMGCPGGGNEQDAWLVDLLGQGVSATLADGVLTLTAGQVVIELAEEDVPEAPEDGDPDQPTSDGDDGVVEY